jgi:D-arabinose 1-dehydrogenase-like Zn-dependent alcohol dehydrogenase
MRAFVITSPQVGSVVEVADPKVGNHDLLVEIERVGICGTDVEFFNGDMAYLASGHAQYPLQLGHEWCGRVINIGNKVAPHWRGLLTHGSLGRNQDGSGITPFTRQPGPHTSARP